MTDITIISKTADSLLTLIDEGESIDIFNVREITGTVYEIMEIIFSTNLTGYGKQDLVILGNIDAEELAFIQQSTTGTISQI